MHLFIPITERIIRLDELIAGKREWLSPFCPKIRTESRLSKISCFEYWKQNAIEVANTKNRHLFGPMMRAAELRIGMIGLDTSHVIAFTRLLNLTNSKDHVPGGRVVAAFKGGSPDIEASRSRVEGYTLQLQTNFGVKIVSTIEELCSQVDAVLLESVDGRPHLEQARPVINAGKRLFIDKPLAGSLKDAIEIYRLAAQKKVPVFSSSSYRFHQSMRELLTNDFGEIRTVVSYGPCSLEPHHPDLFWYGIHPVEALYTVLGRGCEQVVRVSTPDTDVVTGTWAGRKVGILYGHRNVKADHKVMVFGTARSVEQKSGGGYVELVQEIMKFFQTGIPPVSPEETLELFAFMEAADESKRKGGTPVKIRDVMDANRSTAVAK